MGESHWEMGDEKERARGRREGRRIPSLRFRKEKKELRRTEESLGSDKKRG